MAKYTILLNDLMKMGFNPGLDSYPIYSEMYRNVLNQKIIDHYSFWEIGLETPELFKNRLNVKMREIMPYYNRLYRLDIERVLGLKNVDLDETYRRINDGTSDNNQNNTTNSNGTTHSTSSGSSDTTDNGTTRNVSSDLPQSLVTMTDIEGDIYASNATIGDSSNDVSTTNKDTTDGTTTNETTGTATSKTVAKNTEDFTKNIIGMNGNKWPIEVFNLLTEKIVDIDLMIINELQELFMNVW